MMTLQGPCHEYCCQKLKAAVYLAGCRPWAPLYGAMLPAAAGLICKHAGSMRLPCLGQQVSIHRDQPARDSILPSIGQCLIFLVS